MVKSWRDYKEDRQYKKLIKKNKKKYNLRILLIFILFGSLGLYIYGDDIYHYTVICGEWETKYDLMGYTGNIIIEFNFDKSFNLFCSERPLTGTWEYVGTLQNRETYLLNSKLLKEKLYFAIETNHKIALMNYNGVNLVFTKTSY